MTVGNRHFEGGDGNNSGLAWQIIGGADYYLSEKTSIFAEYKFLNYKDAGSNENRIGQHIAVLGVPLAFLKRSMVGKPAARKGAAGFLFFRGIASKEPRPRGNRSVTIPLLLTHSARFVPENALCHRPEKDFCLTSEDYFRPKKVFCLMRRVYFCPKKDFCLTPGDYF